MLTWRLLRPVMTHVWYADFLDYEIDRWRVVSVLTYSTISFSALFLEKCMLLQLHLWLTYINDYNSKILKQKGNIFLCDYKRLDGVTPNVINGKNQYLMAPLVLLHKTPEDKLMPIAIQVRLTYRFTQCRVEHWTSVEDHFTALQVWLSLFIRKKGNWIYGFTMKCLSVKLLFMAPPCGLLK